MCGRYALACDADTLRQTFGTVNRIEHSPRYNIAPTAIVPAVTALENERELCLLRWGLVPSWAKAPSIGSRLFNLRAETVHGKPAFRAALQRRRCLIPASGFYVWQDALDHKRPYHVHASEGGLLALAGLWEHWSCPDGTELKTCAILTIAANPTLAVFHGRMPVVLAAADQDAWLDGEAPLQRLRGLFHPASQGMLSLHPVSERVNNPLHDDPQCTRALGGPSPGTGSAG